MDGRETPTPIEPLTCSAVLTHHWLVRLRGGEKVLEACGELLPAAPIYALVHDPRGIAGSPLAARRVVTSALQRVPGALRHYPKLLPLHAWAFRRLRLPPVDLVLCSDAALAKAMTPAARSKVVCYCHSPARYIWDLTAEYGRTLPTAMRWAWQPLCRRLQAADRSAAQRVDLFIANSRHVAARIKRHYGRDSVVIHPPVELPASPAVTPREDYYVCIGYHVPYKRLDLAIAACRQLGRRLVVIGDGPDVRRIDPRRDGHVQLLGWQSGPVIGEHLRRASALLFPGEEDFGIVPVEALGHGCPVVAYAVGGATETVVPDKTGVWFEQQTVAGLVDAMRRCEKMSFDPHVLHAHAQQFSRARFLAELRSALVQILRQ